MPTQWRANSLWQLSNVVRKHKSGSNERTILILVVSLELRLCFKASRIKKAMWYALGNVCGYKSLCTRGVYTHKNQRQHATFFVVYK